MAITTKVPLRILRPRRPVGFVDVIPSYWVDLSTVLIPKEVTVWFNLSEALVADFGSRVQPKLKPVFGLREFCPACPAA